MAFCKTLSLQAARTSQPPLVVFFIANKFWGPLTQASSPHAVGKYDQAPYHSLCPIPAEMPPGEGMRPTIMGCSHWLCSQRSDPRSLLTLYLLSWCVSLLQLRNKAPKTGALNGQKCTVTVPEARCPRSGCGHRGFFAELRGRTQLRLGAGCPHCSFRRRGSCLLSSVFMLLYVCLSPDFPFLLGRQFYWIGAPPKALIQVITAANAYFQIDSHFEVVGAGSFTDEFSKNTVQPLTATGGGASCTAAWRPEE